MHGLQRAATVFAVLAAIATCQADTTAFFFADPGSSYTGFLFADDPRVGGHVESARIVLLVDVAPGADAANFDADVTLPLFPDEGATPVVALSGSALGWSGSGLFSYTLETSELNGVFQPTLFGGATATLDARILRGSRIELEYTPAPEPGSLLCMLPAGLWLARRRGELRPQREQG